MKKAKRRYNWRPGLPDHRDFLFKPGAPREDFPQTVNLRPGFPPCFDQGDIGSCTGNALAGAMGFHNHGLVASRLFIYFNERSIEGTVKHDAGASIRDGIKSLNKIGVCPETDWLYKKSLLFKKPTTACFRNAAGFKISKYMRATGLDHLRAALAEGSPVSFGFSVFESFESEEVAKTGIVPMPQRTEKLIGGHAVLAVGYDDFAKVVTVRNSWGPDWGDGGYFHMPYAYFVPELTNDYWVIEK